MEKFKTCKKCGQELDINCFYKASSTKDGFNMCCKDCIKLNSKTYYQENREKIDKRKALHREGNKEIYINYSRQFYIKNKINITICKKKYYVDNKKEIDKRQKHYAKNHLEELRIYNQKRKASIKNLPHTLTKEQWLNIKLVFNNNCCYCGKRVPLEQDHFFPLSKNGEYTLNNIIPSCKSCNCSKHDSEFINWYPTYKFYSKKREAKILKFLGYSDQNQQLRII